MEPSAPDNKIRHLVEKKQKGHSLFYWQPSAGLKRSGYKIVSLGKDRAVAMEQAEAINQKVDQWRDGQLVVEKNRHGTLPWLVEQYKKDPAYKKRRSQPSLESLFRQLLKWSAEKGDPPMRAIKRRDALALWSRCAEQEGKLTKAEKLMRTGSVLWNFALRELEDEDVVDKNPFSCLGVDRPPPRQVVWTPRQIVTMIETALVTPAFSADGSPRLMGHRKSIALGIMIAFNTAQRPGDILAMMESQYDGKTIKLTQSKTGTTLSIPVTKELKQALDDELAARGAGNVVSLRQQDRPLVINEVTERRYLLHNFAHLFAAIREAAGLPSALQFRDLRRTATVQLAEAGCEIPEIAAMGGWSINSVHKMLKVYCPLNLTMAQNALVKLENYRAKGKLEG